MYIRVYDVHLNLRKTHRPKWIMKSYYMIFTFGLFIIEAWFWVIDSSVINIFQKTQESKRIVLYNNCIFNVNLDKLKVREQ